MRGAIGFVLIAVAAGLIKRAIDRGFLTDETASDAATTVAIIVFAVLLVEEGLVLMGAVAWVVGK